MFQVEITCWEAHPGLCRSEAANRLSTVALAGKRLCKAGIDKDFNEGDYLAVKTYCGVFVKWVFLMCGYVRRGNPRLIVFAVCDTDLFRANLHLRIVDGSVVFCGHMAAVFDCVKLHEEHRDITQISWCRLKMGNSVSSLHCVPWDDTEEDHLLFDVHVEAMKSQNRRKMRLRRVGRPLV